MEFENNLEGQYTLLPGHSDISSYLGSAPFVPNNSERSNQPQLNVMLTSDTQ